MAEISFLLLLILILVFTDRFSEVMNNKYSVDIKEAIKESIFYGKIL